MRILGIDPGLATVGLGLLEARGSKLDTVEWLTIETAKTASLGMRLQEIADDLRNYLRETRPDHAVVETLFFQTNRKTALDVAHARGVILLTLAEEHIPIIEPNPLQLKQAVTGDGKADKRQMQEMVMRTLRLTEMPSPDDAADALALAIYGAAVAQSHVSK